MKKVLLALTIGSSLLLGGCEIEASERDGELLEDLYNNDEITLEDAIAYFESAVKLFEEKDEKVNEMLASINNDDLRGIIGSGWRGITNDKERFEDAFYRISTNELEIGVNIWMEDLVLASQRLEERIEEFADRHSERLGGN